MAGSKKVAAPPAPPPPPAGCSDRPIYPIHSKNKPDGYQKAAVCAQWKQDNDPEHNRYVITAMPPERPMPALYEVLLEADVDHPPAQGEPPLFEATAYFGCKGRDSSTGAPTQTIRVPVRRRETELAAIGRLEAAATKNRTIDGCPSPRFLSLFLLTGTTRPAGQSHAKK